MGKLLMSGLHPASSDALRRIGVGASQISQTIGHAVASAGTHESDGKAGGAEYCAAVDLRCGDFDDEATRDLLDRLADESFAAFYRHPGTDGWPVKGAEHIHAIFTDCAMKRTLRDQVHDWLHRKNGLARHGYYSFWRPSYHHRAIVRTAFLAHNPANG
jgi:hypothetical protein